jgi:hypothetical protein
VVYYPFAIAKYIYGVLYDHMAIDVHQSIQNKLDIPLFIIKYIFNVFTFLYL